MDGPTTPGNGRYVRPPAYDDHDEQSPQLHSGPTMRLLTNVDDSESYNMS